MPDKRKHRGQHPADKQLFTEKSIPLLRTAVQDFSWLLSRGYAPNASLKLVGDKFRFKERQRMAIRRCGCDEASIQKIEARQCQAAEIKGRHIQLDGFNVLIIVESALSGGLILKGMDHCYKDLASIHSTYRRVNETVTAIELIGESMQSLGLASAKWYLDQPVSNSGRLKVMLLEVAAKKGWNWEVELVYNPDTTLIANGELVASSDNFVIQEATAWFNLTGWIIDHHLPESQVINLRP